MSREQREELSAATRDESSTSTQTPDIDELAAESDAIRRERCAEVAHLD